MYWNQETPNVFHKAAISDGFRSITLAYLPYKYYSTKIFTTFEDYNVQNEDDYSPYLHVAPSLDGAFIHNLSLPNI